MTAGTNCKKFNVVKKGQRGRQEDLRRGQPGDVQRHRVLPGKEGGFRPARRGALCIEKGYSSREEMQSRLRRLLNTGLQLFTTRIAGADNLADLPSRGHRPLDERRRHATFEVLRALPMQPSSSPRRDRCAR